MRAALLALLEDYEKERQRAKLALCRLKLKEVEMRFYKNYTTDRRTCQVKKEKVPQEEFFLTEIPGYEGKTKLASDWNLKHPVPKEHLGNLFLKLFDYEKDPIYNGVQPAARSVLALIIADTIACNRWEAWISRSKFERFTGYSNTTITKALQFLEDNNYIKSHYVCKRCYFEGHNARKIKREYEFRWWGNGHGYSSFGWVPSLKRCPTCGTNLWAPKAVLRIYYLVFSEEIFNYVGTPYELLDCLSSSYTLTEFLKALTSKYCKYFGIFLFLKGREDQEDSIVKSFSKIKAYSEPEKIPRAFKTFEECEIFCFLQLEWGLRLWANLLTNGRN